MCKTYYNIKDNNTHIYDKALRLPCRLICELGRGYKEMLVEVSSANKDLHTYLPFLVLFCSKWSKTTKWVLITSYLCTICLLCT